MNHVLRFVRWTIMLLAVSGSAALCGEIRIVVKNPSAVARQNEPVIVVWKQVIRLAPDLDPGKLQLKDEHQQALPVQVDDLEGDGVPDELTFQADLGPRGSRTFTLASGPADTGGHRTPRTDAADYKRIDGVLQSIVDDDVPGNGRIRKAYRFDGVGWESDIIAYRLYLDARNAVDILGKRKPGVYWSYIGTSGVDYQLDADWGTDVLHVGDAVGLGGIGFWVADSVEKPVSLDRQRTRILARGPVRAVVRVEYFGWEVGKRKANVTSLFTIYAGDRASEQRVTVSPLTPPLILATGIVRHDSTRLLWDPHAAWLCTTGRQSRFSDSLMMALCVRPADLIKKTRDDHNEVLLLRPGKREPLRILLSSYWQGETGRMWTSTEIHDFLNATALRLRQPLTIHLDAPEKRPR